MKRKIKEGTGLYAFLEKTGVLANGTPEDIEYQKRKYWSQYRKEWKKNKRQQSKVYVVIASFKEARVINQKSKALKVTPATYLRQSGLKSDVLLGPVMLADLREKLVLFASRVEDIMEEHSIEEHIHARLVNETTALETAILAIVTKQ